MATVCCILMSYGKKKCKFNNISADIHGKGKGNALILVVDDNVDRNTGSLSMDVDMWNGIARKQYLQA